MECRNCKKELVSVLDLGELYPSNFVETTVGEKIPLEMMVCSECGLVQLNENAELDSMYRQYWYKSSLNKTMITALQDIVGRVKEFGYTKGNILDIGANDGTLLKLFGEDYFRVGIDPALNLADEAKVNCEIFINDYFPSEKLPETKFDVITSIAMFYDLPDPNSFVEAIKEYLKDDGMWVVQFTDLKSMLQLNAFDNICHEHLEYYSLSFLNTFFTKHDLSICFVEYNEVNGGSIRLYVDKKFRPVHYSVGYYLYDEYLYMTSFYNPFEAFKERVLDVKERLMTFMECIDNVYVVGASTKGNTLLQYYGLTDVYIKKALEVNRDKFGLKTVGTNIPIVDEDYGLKENPEFLLILPWHFTDFFLKIFSNYLMDGGKLIVPLPIPAVAYLGKYGKIVWEEI